MLSALYLLIHMAIKMARESSLFFSVVNLMYCITVAKRSCYGLLKIKRSYHIVLYYVLIYFIHSGSQPTAMNAVLVIIADSEQAIIVINREAVHRLRC